MIALKSNTALDFKEQSKLGKRGEETMDRFFSRWFDIHEINGYEQLIIKYDRVFQVKGNSDEKYKVEYKTDLQAVRTGNFYVEIDMTDSRKARKGWLYETRADWIAVLVGNKIYLTDTEVLRNHIFRYKNIYKQRKSRPTFNGQYYYQAIGYLMPLKHLEMISNIYSIVS